MTTSTSQPPNPAPVSQHRAGSTDAQEHPQRPAAIRHISAPPYQSPLHHHERMFRPRKNVKVTADAHSEYANSQDDGTAEHRINQYVVKQEIGRGSFGSVHLAVDQFNREFAVKEFSKARLRKRMQSNLLRRHPNRTRSHTPYGRGFNLPLARHSESDAPTASNAFDLIKEEIAIMKKLNHPNVVSLLEVLDDPKEDLLYMVMEMCKKGVVMQVGLDERAEPYDSEKCRLWFRDLILGVEYLHAQGIVHRDIKPDNCLITSEDVLKIVDFGVSEMFSKDSEMTTSKSAGSPAFLPPELCVAKHGEVSGRAVDVWSMGVTLYCLAFGTIPFEMIGMVELYHAIRNDAPIIPEDCDPSLKDLLIKLLEKDPAKRIELDDVREHPWVTLDGKDLLLSKEQNTLNLIEPPTQEEVNRAITAPMRRMVVVMKAAAKFKRLIAHKRPDFLHGMFGSSQMVAPPDSIESESENDEHGQDSRLARMQSDSLADRKPIEGNLTTEGIVREINVSDDLKTTEASEKINIKDKVPIVSKEQWGSILRGSKPHIPFHADPQRDEDESQDPANDKSIQSPLTQSPLVGSPLVESPLYQEPRTQSGVASPVSDHGKGHAHDPLTDTLFLHIGASADSAASDLDEVPTVSESPSAVVEANVYERAYEEEIQRILQQRKEQGHRPTLFLTKRVEDVAHLRDSEDITDFDRAKKAPALGFAALARAAKEAAAREESRSTQEEPDKPIT